MELPPTLLDSLNARLPPGFLVETADSQSRHRRTEVEALHQSHPPAEPPARLRLVKDPSVRQPESPFPALQPAPVQPISPPALAVAQPDSIHSNEAFERMFEIVTRLREHSSYQWVEKAGVDFKVVEGKVLREEYVDGKEFAREVRKVLKEALALTPKGSDEYMSFIDLHSLFEHLLKGLDSLPIKRPRVDPSAALLSLEAKKELGMKIRSLDPKYCRGIYDIVKNSLKTSESGELEFDLDKLPASVCKGLAEYVDICLQKSQVPPTTEAPSSSSESEVTYSASHVRSLDSPVDPRGQDIVSWNYSGSFSRP